MAKFPTTNLLSGLPKQLSAGLFAGASLVRLESRQTLFRAGDLGDGCYRLEQGLLKVVVASRRGEERIIAILGPGAIVGELSMIDGLPRSASVCAIRACTFRYISRDAFAKWASTHGEIYKELVGVLTSRLREADEMMAATSFLTVKGRVARALLELAEHVGEKDASGHIVLNHKIDQADLAAMAGVARENVSRTLSEWRRRKLVTQVAQNYCLANLEELTLEMDLGA